MNFEADSIVEKLFATPILFCAIFGPVTRHVCIIDHKVFLKIEEAAMIFWFLCVLNHGRDADLTAGLKVSGDSLDRHGTHSSEWNDRLHLCQLLKDFLINLFLL